VTAGRPLSTGQPRAEGHTPGAPPAFDAGTSGCCFSDGCLPDAHGRTFWLELLGFRVELSFMRRRDEADR